MEVGIVKMSFIRASPRMTLDAGYYLNGTKTQREELRRAATAARRAKARQRRAQEALLAQIRRAKALQESGDVVIVHTDEML